MKNSYVWQVNFKEVFLGFCVHARVLVFDGLWNRSLISTAPLRKIKVHKYVIWVHLVMQYCKMWKLYTSCKFLRITVLEFKPWWFEKKEQSMRIVLSSKLSKQSRLDTFYPWHFAAGDIHLKAFYLKEIRSLRGFV